MRLLALTLVLAALPAMAAEYPHWDGEPIDEYAKKVGLPPTKTIDLGDGVTMEFVLIPAGTFTMGTGQPEDFGRHITQIAIALVAIGLSAAFLVYLATYVIVALRDKQRPQVSLAGLVVLVVAAGIGLLGGQHLWHTLQALAEARAKSRAALAGPDGAERPAHKVTLTQPFYIGRYEVTQQQYKVVTGTNPSSSKDRPDLPVEMVSWLDAKAFCKKLAGPGTHVRLPTEAEWEYACRAGTKTKYCSGDAETDLAKVGWYDKNSKDRTHPVGRKPGNLWGVYDMHGNVVEWCEDHWHNDYEGAPSDGQAWVYDAQIAEPSVRHRSVDYIKKRAERGGAWLSSSWTSPESHCRVLRGGASIGEAWNARSAARNYVDQHQNSCNSVGFRLVLEVE